MIKYGQEICALIKSPYCWSLPGSTVMRKSAKSVVKPVACEHTIALGSNGSITVASKVSTFYHSREMFEPDLVTWHSFLEGSFCGTWV